MPQPEKRIGKVKKDKKSIIQQVLGVTAENKDLSAAELLDSKMIIKIDT